MSDGGNDVSHGMESALICSILEACWFPFRIFVYAYHMSAEQLQIRSGHHLSLPLSSIAVYAHRGTLMAFPLSTATKQELIQDLRQ